MFLRKTGLFTVLTLSFAAFAVTACDDDSGSGDTDGHGDDDHGDDHGHDDDHGDDHGDDADGDHGGEAHDDICYHLENGPSESITASDDPDTAPMTGSDHTRLEIEMPATGPGYIAFEFDEAADFAMGLDADLEPVVTSATGDAIMLEVEDEHMDEWCAELSALYMGEFEAGTYTIMIPEGVTSIHMVISEAAHGHDHG